MHRLGIGERVPICLISPPDLGCYRIESHCAPAPTEQAVRCDHVETNVFASAPSKSKAVGWLSGELGRSSVTHEISEGKLISKSAEEGS